MNLKDILFPAVEEKAPDAVNLEAATVFSMEDYLESFATAPELVGPGEVEMEKAFLSLQMTQSIQTEVEHAITLVEQGLTAEDEVKLCRHLEMATGGVVTVRGQEADVEKGSSSSMAERTKGALKKAQQYISVMIKKLLKAVTKFFREIFSQNARLAKGYDALLEDLKKHDASTEIKAVPDWFSLSRLGPLLSLARGEVIMPDKVPDLIKGLAKFDLDKFLKGSFVIEQVADGSISGDKAIEKLIESLENAYPAMNAISKTEVILGIVDGPATGVYIKQDPGAQSSKYQSIPSVPVNMKMLDTTVGDMIESLEAGKQMLKATSNDKSIRVCEAAIEKVLKDIEKEDDSDPEKIKEAQRVSTFFFQLTRANVKAISSIAQAVYSISAGLRKGLAVKASEDEK